MQVYSSDNNRVVNVGSVEIWNVLYSTVVVRLDACSDDITDAIRFLETKRCVSKNALETARQLNIVRDRLSQFNPEKVVSDISNPSLQPSWIDRISPVITSCSNLFTTADGKDLLYELVSLLCYSHYANRDVLFTE